MSAQGVRSATALAALVTSAQEMPSHPLSHEEETDERKSRE